MAQLTVVIEGLEREAEDKLRADLLSLLQGVRENVVGAFFGGSGNGSPNFDIGDVKGDADVAVAAPATPPEPEVEPLTDGPAEPSAPAPTPVTTGIDPNTLGSSGPALS